MFYFQNNCMGVDLFIYSNKALMTFMLGLKITHMYWLAAFKDVREQSLGQVGQGCCPKT